MQQREQLILKKLAEAREAQASTLARFIQARTRVMQVEARLQAIRARLATSNMPPDQAPEASTLPANSSIAPVPDNHHPATLLTNAQPASSTLTPALSETPQAISDVPTTLLALEQPVNAMFPPDLMAELDDDEDTKKQPAIIFTRPPTPPAATASKVDISEEETLIVTLSELMRARELDQAISNPQERQVSELGAQPAGETGTATDITAKIPVIRQERRPPQESSS